MQNLQYVMPSKRTKVWMFLLQVCLPYLNSKLTDYVERHDWGSVPRVLEMDHQDSLSGKVRKAWEILKKILNLLRKSIRGEEREECVKVLKYVVYWLA